ncbi:MAG: restriction endonuclease subunit S [Ignavibacteriae bacterium]|nr:restriction endonuclease subunit S [Ignavibacteriota bacterium]
MAEWKEYKLKEVIETFIDYRGKTPTKTERGIPLITAKIVKDGRILEPNEFIAEDNYEEWMTRGFPEINDVVLTTEAPLGEVALLKDKKVALAQRIITLRGKKNICDNIFLKYYLQSNVGQALLQSRAQGSVVEGIKSSELKELEIGLPDYLIQRAIASILSSLDDKIDLLHRQNKTLEALAETLFRQWFVEEAEEGWEEKTLKDIAINVKANVSPKYFTNDIIYVGLEHIDRKQIVLNSYGSSTDVSSNKSLFKENDILFGKLRPYFHKVCYAPFNGICSTDILVIRPKESIYFAFCLFTLFQKELVDYSDLSSEGTRMPRTSWEIIGDYPIFIPDTHTLECFNKVTLPTIAKMKNNTNQIRTLTQLRDTLLPKLMSGEVRVS